MCVLSVCFGLFWAGSVLEDCFGGAFWVGVLVGCFECVLGSCFGAGVFMGTRTVSVLGAW